MCNLERFNNCNSLNLNKWNKVLDSLKLSKRVFKKLYPLKNTPWLDYLTFHISNKDKIINQFEENKDLTSFLDNNLPEGKILYIDYIEVSPRERWNWIWRKIVEKIIKRSKDIWLNGIYLDSYECSMNFWEKNWFSIDEDIQEKKDWEESDYHSAFLKL
jgi:GNAT superfamily N-acetyltransferase